MDAIPAHMASHRNGTQTLDGGEYCSATADLGGIPSAGPAKES
jgi:hypothetical protein